MRLKDFFIPHRGNDYAPHSLQKAAVVGMLFMIVLSFAIANVQSLLWISSKFMVGSVLPAVIVDLTNKERVGDSLGTLHRNALLDEAATMKAQDMLKNQYFAHTSPAGTTPWFWFKKVSYNFVNAGENLAVHFTDSSDVVTAWMKSPEHRANILNGKYTEIGVGTAEGEFEGYHTIFVVQLFGTPAEAAPAPAAPIAAKPQTTNAEDTIKTSNTKASVLAESVSVNESALVATKTASSEASAARLADNADARASTSRRESPSVTDIAQSGTLYSDFVATTTSNAPASIIKDTSATAEAGGTAPYYLRLVTQPHAVLQILYVVLGLFVLISLILSIFIEIRRQQPLQIAYGVALLFLMFGLLYLHALLGGGAVVV